MIIQTGLRTDIPAFYSEWFSNRIKEGFVCVRNPYNPSLVTRYSLSPDVVDLICFCTKNPKPMFQYTDLLSPYGQYWFVTITPYGKETEPNVPDKKEVIESFKTLSDIVGIDSIGWRYDPILITDKYTIERHIHDFERMCSLLSGYTKTCVISFIDIYKKVERNFPEARPVSPEERAEIGKAFSMIAKKNGITVKACAEGKDLEPYGIDCSGCMTKEVFENALHCSLNMPKKNPHRSECNCYLGADIGEYDTCGHLCRYCYANADKANVIRNMKLHDPSSPFLIGNIQEGDKIHEAKQESWIDERVSLF